MPSEPNDNPTPKNRASANDLARYSGLAFQMLSTILLGTLGGWWLDTYWLMWHFPCCTFVAVILSVVAAIYWAIKDLLKK